MAGDKLKLDDFVTFYLYSTFNVYVNIISLQIVRVVLDFNVWT